MKKILSAFALSVFTLSAYSAEGPFHAVVAADGSGDYTTVSEAIENAPEGRTEPWIIFVKRGDYVEHVSIPTAPSVKSPPFNSHYLPGKRCDN